MPQIYSFFIVSIFALLLTSSCSTSLHPSDVTQRQLNEKAYQSRFNREPIPEEKTGIRLSPRLKTESGSVTETREDLKWKMILITGDDSINAFDNARTKLHGMFKEFGINESIQLSRSSTQQVNGIRATSIPNIEKAAQDLKVQPGDGCLVYMTSHGKTTGFYIRGQDYLTPTKLNQIINDTCGTQPTILLVSACYAGVFAEPSLQMDNRIILTAARKDKTSFGCSAEAEYTCWDGCMIDSLETSLTWFELAQQVEKCIERKESAGGFARSYPQARFGADVVHLPIRN